MSHSMFYLFTISGIVLMFNAHARDIHNHSKMVSTPMTLYIIVGSVRPTKTGEKIAHNLVSMLDKRTDIKTEIIMIADYRLPFYMDTTSPSSRKGEPTDPVLQEWSRKISSGNAYIIVSPEYNFGYPAPLKNALDSLYKEWNNKPVAFVGYAGGPSGGSSMIAQLRQVAQGLEMLPVSTDVKIPQSWKAFDQDNRLINYDAIAHDINVIATQLLAEHNKTHKAL